MRQEIFVTGFPRSGNTWLNRLLRDMLDAPLQNLPGTPMVWEHTEDIGENFVIRKTHWYRSDYDRALRGSRQPGYLEPDHKIVWIYRDPRDMAVSTMFYRKSDDLMKVIRSLSLPDNPSKGLVNFVNGWLENPPDFMISYRELHECPVETLSMLCTGVLHTYVTTEKIRRVVERQSFDNWKAKYPHSMRKGVVGDWRNYFDREAAELMDAMYGDIIIRLRYEKDHSWVLEV